jgi:hypothetical protein
VADVTINSVIPTGQRLDQRRVVFTDASTGYMVFIDTWT